MVILVVNVTWQAIYMTKGYLIVDIAEHPHDKGFGII